MNIVSAVYLRDPKGNAYAVSLTYDDDSSCSVPINGTTWRNTQLTEWLAADPANQITG